MTTSVFETIGGLAGVRALVERFYQRMDSDPAALEIRKLHPEDLTGSEEKLYLFLVGWLGGPPLFVEKYGHPRLRARHLPFTIGERERDQWMACMRFALSGCELDPETLARLDAQLYQLADHMRNEE
jgi:hemoglobin